MSTSREAEVAGLKCRDRGRKTLKDCVNDDIVVVDMKLLGFQPE